MLFYRDGLSDVLALTTADLRFVDYLTHHMGDQMLEETQWEGSDDWIRAQFKLYMLSMLSCSLSLGNHQSAHWIVLLCAVYFLHLV